MHGMPTSGVRPARVDDAEGIGSVNVRSWRARFAAVLPHEALASLQPDDLALVWAGSILNPPSSRHRVLVAVEDDVLVGYAAVGPGADPDADSATGELIALEVDPAHERQGHGSRLLTASADHAAAAGFRTLEAWCPLADERRREFLQSAGFGPDTAYRDVWVGVLDDGTDRVVREVRLATDLIDHGVADADGPSAAPAHT
jgi:GNAT superfamily N-acetyltransferase